MVDQETFLRRSLCHLSTRMENRLSKISLDFTYIGFAFVCHCNTIRCTSFLQSTALNWTRINTLVNMYIYRDKCSESGDQFNSFPSNQLVQINIREVKRKRTREVQAMNDAIKFLSKCWPHCDECQKIKMKCEEVWRTRWWNTWKILFSWRMFITTMVWCWSTESEIRYCN